MDGASVYLTGIAVSAGVAFGSTFLYRPELPEIQRSHFASDPVPYIGAYERGLHTADAQLSSICQLLQARGEDSSKIFAAQREILLDEELDACVRTAITEERLTVPAAVEQVYEQFAHLLAQAADPLIAARAADIRDVKLRILRILLGMEAADLSLLPQGTILVARDLLPSDAALLDPDCIAAIVTEQGNQTSHTAILAKSLGIPAVLAVQGAMEAIPSRTFSAVDALSGEIFCQPEEALCRHLRDKQASFQENVLRQQKYLYRQAVTTDGAPIKIGVNIGGQRNDFSSCDYCGLFRTEFLFLDRQILPDEQTQFAEYRRVVEQAGGKLVTLRMLDIGGDKSIPCLPLPKEDNPFLGCRALRLLLKKQDLFRSQLRAALRASAYGPIQIMYPMVGSLTDFRRAKALTRQVMEELEAEGIPCGKEIPCGVMIEIPSIALIADMAAEEVDFASVGTNDLCQYLCAADRLNPAVAEHYENFSPAVLRCLRDIRQAFDRAEKPVSICGEMAGDLRAVKLLVGLGYRSLSMSAGQHAAVKAAICGFSLEEARILAEKALACRTQAEVLALLEQDGSCGSAPLL